MVVLALYNRAKCHGMGIFQYQPGSLGPAGVAQYLMPERPEDGASWYLDYVKGRVMKVRVERGAKTINTRLYARDNGEGAGARAVQAAREAWAMAQKAAERSAAREAQGTKDMAGFIGGIDGVPEIP